MTPQYWPPAGVHETRLVQPRSTATGASSRTPASKRLAGPPPVPVLAPPPPPTPGNGCDGATRAHDSAAAASASASNGAAAEAAVTTKPLSRRDNIAMAP